MTYRIDCDAAAEKGDELFANLQSARPRCSTTSPIQYRSSFIRGDANDTVRYPAPE